MTEVENILLLSLARLVGHLEHLGVTTREDFADSLEASAGACDEATADGLRQVASIFRGPRREAVKLTAIDGGAPAND